MAHTRSELALKVHDAVDYLNTPELEVNNNVSFKLGMTLQKAPPSPTRIHDNSSDALTQT